MLVFFLFVFSFLLVKNFSKRLIPLLSLEGFMLVIIWGIYTFGTSVDESSFFAYAMVLLVLMVIDSVLGICILISSCRSSAMWTLTF